MGNRFTAHFAVKDTPVSCVEHNFDIRLRQIVIKGDLGFVVDNGFTGLEAYVYPFCGRILPPEAIKSPSKQALLNVCNMLNYIISHYPAKTMSDITADMVFRFFDYYRELPKADGTYITDSTLQTCVRSVSCFLANYALAYPECRCKPEDLLFAEFAESVEKQKTKRKRSRYKTIYIPIYRKKALEGKRNHPIREIPEAAIPMLLEMVKKYDPMIYFAVVLERYAGIRASEGMNIRQEDSPIRPTPGISITRIGTAIQKIEIDLTGEFRMRSDGVDVGKIKRRTDKLTPVYPPNNEIVYKAYLQHKELLSHTKYEADYRPMFVCRNGKAMTYQTYLIRFEKIVSKHLCPALLKSSDNKLVAFGQLLLSHKFPTHGLRHSFSVQLAIEGLDAAQIQAYRGDRNVDSSLVYLQNKGLLEDQLRTAQIIALEGLKANGRLYNADELN